MTQFIRRIASMKLNSRGVQASSRSKDQETWKNTIINKERDKLLQEFLLAREELKAQFDLEKREMVGNYERRVRYLRRLLEDCDENINMLKLNLDAEREENFILKTRIMELENRLNQQNIEDSKPADDITTGYLNQSYDKESLIKSCSCSRENSTRKSACTFLTGTSERSSIGGLKYSDRFASCGSVGDDSCFTSVSTIPSTVGDDVRDLHVNCRKEFSRLLEELRNKEERFNAQLKTEKEKMNEDLENEKLQMERVVYRQLNIRLEREIKKQELLFTENAHLRRTISDAIMERMHCQCQDNNRKPTDGTTSLWKANNSDSGADAEDIHSDDGSDGSTDSGKGSLTLSDGKLSGSRENINAVVIHKLLESPFHCKQNNHTHQEDVKRRTNKKLKSTFKELDTGLNSLVNKDQTLVGKSDVNEECLHEEMRSFNEDLQHKLVELEELLMADSSDC